MTELLRALNLARSKRKLLVPYLVPGVPDEAGFATAFDAIVRHADAIEVGVPFSDPLMDGPVIAAATERALRRGVTPTIAMEMGARDAEGVPRVVMTYYNPVHRIGEDVFCRRLAELGYQGLIVPDLPLDESVGLRMSAAVHGIAWIPLVAPTTTPERARSIAEAATGFVYAVSTLGVTGERATLSKRAEQVVRMCRDVTDLPILVGVGVSTSDHAREAAATADGVVIGSALIKQLLESGPAAATDLISSIRDALNDREPEGQTPRPANK